MSSVLRPRALSKGDLVAVAGVSGALAPAAEMLLERTHPLCPVPERRLSTLHC